MSNYSTPVYDYCPNCGAKTKLQPVDGHVIKACSAKCGFAHFNNPTPVVAVIVETPDGVVLAHNVAWPAGIFSIITGFVDPLELPEQTAIRETEEELGLKAYDAKFVGHYMFEQKNQLIIAYAVKAQGKIKMNHELDEYKVIPVHKLKGWRTATGEAVTDWVNNLGPLKPVS
jgi:NADH pyrophosphatase NudC (nudix superfamily)